jgi:hypothetical protein
MIAISDLPPSNTRWTTVRKKLLMDAIEGGLLTAEEAKKRYFLSEEELDSWKALLQRRGIQGLRSTYLQSYRGHAMIG